MGKTRAKSSEKVPGSAKSTSIRFTNELVENLLLMLGVLTRLAP